MQQYRHHCSQPQPDLHLQHSLRPWAHQLPQAQTQPHLEHHRGLPQRLYHRCFRKQRHTHSRLLLQLLVRGSPTRQPQKQALPQQPPSQAKLWKRRSSDWQQQGRGHSPEQPEQPQDSPPDLPAKLQRLQATQLPSLEKALQQLEFPGRPPYGPLPWVSWRLAWRQAWRLTWLAP